ncbi:glycosyltransferase family 39 protein [Verrucomicrobiaceae bacterium 227]
MGFSIRSGVIWGAVAGLMVWLVATAIFLPEPKAREFNFAGEAKWIRVADENQRTGCFRTDFFLGAEVDHAWVAVSSEGGFELLCNGNPVGALSYWRPTRPFQNGLTEGGQRAVTTDPAMALNFPREYQWAGHANHRIPVYFDLRPFLEAGHNTLCVEIESRSTGAAFCLSGKVSQENGEEVSLSSNGTWKGEPVPKGLRQREWMVKEAEVEHWENAREVPDPSGGMLTFVPRGMFESPFDGEWMMGNRVGSRAGQLPGQDFVYEWDQDEGVDDAWVRVVSRGPYLLWVNGEVVRPATREKRGLGDGGWLVGWEGRRPLATPPTLLDPDETGDYFVGHRFETPRHGDPTVNDFKRFENMLNRTRERASATKQGEGLDDKYAEKEGKGRPSDPMGFLEEPDGRVPPEVSRLRGGEELHGYAVGALLKKGGNEIRVRLLAEPEVGYRRSRSVGAAVDGRIFGRDGGLKEIHSGPGWRGDWKGEELQMVTGASAGRAGSAFPQLKYIGEARSGKSWKLESLGAVFFVFVAIGFLERRSVRADRVAFGFLATVACLILLKFSFQERSEILWFRDGMWTWWVLLCGLGGGALMLLMGKEKGAGRWRMPTWLLMGGVVLLTLVLRGWEVSDQPIDDDEYASIQAVVSIADSGLPEIGDGIWYSRSPLYHYLAGAVAAVFGVNLYVLRMLSVLTAVVTVWVVWRMGLRYFHSRWIAGAASLLFAVHPFLIFSGHIARFYQQQQLFVLLLIDFFLRGFVVAGECRWRVWAVFIFGAAVLSQEISISMVPVLVVLYILFGRDVSWRWEVKTVLAIVVVATVVAGDIILFQLKCLTRATGVSPNVEATIAPNFWEQGNLLSMFVGYSRLHVVLSVFWVVGFFSALKQGNRLVISLYVSLVVAILFLNLLITSVSFRYQYTLIPLWILLGCHGMWVTFEWLGRWCQSKGGARLLRATALIIVILSWSPWRVLDSYDEKLLGDPISGLQHVKANLRENDRIMITEPHPHAAKMELGRVDYDLVVPILYDFAYSDEGLLRDRNGDAEVVNRLARLQEIFATEERVWILLNREKFRSRKKNLRWEYPGAREELFIRENCELVFRSYLWHVYLWDQGNGKYRAFRSEPGGWSE